MASKALKEQIVKELQAKGFGPQKAKDLIEEHIDIVEVNEDELTPKEIAEQLEEEYEQGR